MTIKDDWLAEARKLYDEPNRFYHTWNHIQSCLALLDEIEDDLHVMDVFRIMCALVYHDIVYDTRTKDSEERSAATARLLLSGWGVGFNDLNEVERLIRLTKHHTPADDDSIGHIMCDIDCAILGASYVDYVEYVSGVRKEYGWVSEDEWKVGRSAVLTGFLARPRIFRSGFFDHLEEPARANISRELELLR